LFIYQLLLNWLHVSTLQDHHQAFIMNQVIHQPLYRPKQIRAGKYAVGRKIGLEMVKTSLPISSYTAILRVT
jgi:hypothetical protein